MKLGLASLCLSLLWRAARRKRGNVKRHSARRYLLLTAYMRSVSSPKIYS